MTCELRDLADIVAISKPRKRTCGVYFLFAKGKLIYVGSSKNIESRLAEHQRATGHQKWYDSFSVIDCNEDHLFSEERKYRNQFRGEIKKNYARLHRMFLKGVKND